MAGLGVRSIHIINQWFLMEQVWKVFSQPQSLLSRVLDMNINLSLPFGILHAQGSLFKGCAWKFENGISIKAFAQRWINNSIPIATPNLTLRQVSNARVHDFINPELHIWKASQVKEFFSFKDAQLILAMELPDINAEDYMYWAQSLVTARGI